MIAFLLIINTFVYKLADCQDTLFPSLSLIVLDYESVFQQNTDYSTFRALKEAPLKSVYHVDVNKHGFLYTRM